MTERDLENTKAQMRKGTLEFAVLLLIADTDIYAGNMIKELKEANLIVVEGTLYPLLNRLKHEGLLEYTWQESDVGPPRKYYRLTTEGHATLTSLMESWSTLATSLTKLIKKYEKNV